MIYCVEDESSIRDLMVYTLKASGYYAQGFKSGAGFWAAMKEQRPELVILDVMLPGEDGLTILKKLRSSPVSAGIPVIMATAKDSEYDKVIGLDSGADDYLAKPFGLMEMISRIKAVLRRSSPKQVKTLTCGGISKEVGGTGLGLSIVKHAVMIHNGRIEVNSEIGSGTKFIVIIPNEPKEQSNLQNSRIPS